MGGLLSSHIEPYDKSEGEGDELNQSENDAPTDAPDPPPRGEDSSVPTAEKGGDGQALLQSQTRVSG